MNLLLIQLLQWPKPVCHRREVWMYKRADFDNINVALEQELPPRELLNSLPVENSWIAFEEKCSAVMCAHIPRQTVTCRRAQPPWFTRAVTRRLNKSHGARKEAKRCGSDHSWAVYRRLRNRAVAAIRQAKQSFFASLKELLCTPREFWKAYNSVMHPKPASLPTITDGTRVSTTPIEKAEMLNSFFSSCFGPSTLPATKGEVTSPVKVSSQEEESMINGSKTVPLSATLTQLECGDHDVFCVLTRLQEGKASGPDNWSVTMLKRSAPSISGHLADIFN